MLLPSSTKTADPELGSGAIETLERCSGLPLATPPLCVKVPPLWWKFPLLVSVPPLRSKLTPFTAKVLPDAIVSVPELASDSWRVKSLLTVKVP